MDAAEYKRVRGEILFIDARKLGAMTALADLTLFPGWRLEQLKEDRTGQYSIRINDQYRICFQWNGIDVLNVEITDCH